MYQWKIFDENDFEILLAILRRIHEVSRTVSFSIIDGRNEESS